jgi:hypothetical protein
MECCDASLDELPLSVLEPHVSERRIHHAIHQSEYDEHSSENGTQLRQEMQQTLAHFSELHHDRTDFITAKKTATENKRKQ